MSLTEIEKGGGEGGGGRGREGGGYFPCRWDKMGKIILKFGLVILKCLLDIQVETLGGRCENRAR